MVDIGIVKEGAGKGGTSGGEPVHANAPAQQVEQVKKEPKPHKDRQIKQRGTAFLKKYLPIAIIYLVISLFMFAPITANITSVAPGTGGDTYLNLWSIWWVPYAVGTLHTSIWSTNLLYWPIGANLVYQTMAPIGAMIVAPFQAISIPFAYNMMFFLGYALSGLTMYVLANYLTGNKYAAFFAGLVYTFSAFHIAQAYSHIDWVNIAWIPLALYFLLKIFKDEKKYWSAAGLAVSLVLVSFMGDVEQTIMTVLLLALVLVLYAVFKSTRKLVISKKVWTAFGIAIILTFIIGSFGFVPMLGVITNGGLSNANYLNDVPHNLLWSDDLLSFFLPSYFNGIFNGVASTVYYNIYEADPTERVSYIGYTVLLLALYGLWKDFKQTRMWLVVALVFGWLALGPYIQIGSTINATTGTMNNTGIPGLYLLYHAIPGLNVIREPGRFDVIFSLAAALLAAFGLAALYESMKKNASSFITKNSLEFLAILVVLFLIENNGLPLSSSLQSQVITHIYVPTFYNDIASVAGNFSVLPLPILTNPNSDQPSLYPGMATYYTSASKVPIIGGDITRTNQTEELSVYNIPLTVEAENLQAYGSFSYASPVDENYSNETILTLYNYETAFIALDLRAYNQSSLNEMESYMVATFGQPVYLDNTTAVFDPANVINNSIYRSFVSYPVLTLWQGPLYSLVNGTEVPLWMPVDGGTIITYAPYSNTTDINSQIYSSNYQTINATVRFYAVADGGPVSLSVEQAVDGSLVNLGTFNLTSGLQAYSLNTVMLSGPVGNEFFFVPHQASTFYTNATAIVTSVSFTKGS